MKGCSGLAATAAVGLTPGVGAFVARAAQQAPPPLSPGTIITVAGNGKPGLSGDGWPAVQGRRAPVRLPAVAALRGPPARARAPHGNDFEHEHEHQ